MDELYEQLSNNVMKITFEKKDGSTREMLCTRKQDSLPETQGTGSVAEGIIPVYDLEKQAWRSFRVDSIISSEIIENV